MTTRQRTAATSPTLEMTAEMQAETLNRLTTLMERLWEPRQQEPGRDRFKAPRYDGKTDVDLFLLQFEEVSRANEWGEGTATLHMREAIQEGAKECGRPQNLAGIIAALRARYGMTAREARAALARLKRDVKTTLQEHAAEVEKLVNLAHADLPAEYRTNMLVDVFSATLGNAYLQRHLLAVHAPTLELAVRAGNEYLQIQPTNFRQTGRPNVTQVADEEDTVDEDVAVQEVRTLPVERDNPMTEVLKVLRELAAQINRMSTSATNGDRGPRRFPNQSEGTKTSTCWGCRKTGHMRRDCKEVPWTPRTAPAQGNGRGPQQ